MTLRLFFNMDYLKYALMSFVVVLLVACSGGGDGGIGGGSADISWTAPSARADNNALLLSDIAGYRIYYGVEKGVYLGWVEINDGSITQAQLSGIPSGRYFVAMTAIDSDGLESGYSLEVEVVI